MQVPQDRRRPPRAAEQPRREAQHRRGAHPGRRQRGHAQGHDRPRDPQGRLQPGAEEQQQPAPVALREARRRGLQDTRRAVGAEFLVFPGNIGILVPSRS